MPAGNIVISAKLKATVKPFLSTFLFILALGTAQILGDDFHKVQSNEFSWNDTNNPSGMYFARLIVEGETRTMKILYLKKIMRSFSTLFSQTNRNLWQHQH